MDSFQAGSSAEILLFEQNEASDGTGLSALKNFLSFLKMNKAMQPLRFSYTDSEGSLIPALSLKENISLDSIPSTVSSTKKFTLEDYLERMDNPFLIKLYHKIELVEDLPYQVDGQTRKMAALVKGLLQKADFLFLDRPEQYLDPESLKVFRNALLHNLQVNKQTLLLTSERPSFWAPYVTKTVSQKRCQETGKIELKCESRVVSNLTSPNEQNGDSGVLVFNHPGQELKITKSTRKKAS